MGERDLRIMSTLTLRALCDLGELGNWQVWCLRCKEEVGTMSSKTLNDAIWRTRSRGGILCPPCRAASCAKCGDELERKSEKAKGECGLCELMTDPVLVDMDGQAMVQPANLSSCTYLFNGTDVIRTKGNCLEHEAQEKKKLGERNGE